MVSQVTGIITESFCRNSVDALFHGGCVSVVVSRDSHVVAASSSSSSGFLSVAVERGVFEGLVFQALTTLREKKRGKKRKKAHKKS